MRLQFYCGSLSVDPPCPELWVVETTPEAWMLEVIETRCPSCGSINHQVEGRHEVIDRGLPLAVCLVVQNEHRQVLAVSRKDDHTAFGLPGGKVDPEDGEVDSANLWGTLRVAMCREALEELGVHLEPGDLVLEYQLPDPTGYWNVCFSAPANLLSDAETQPDEGITSWVDWSTLEDGPFADFNRSLRGHLEEPPFDPLTAPIEEIDAYLREHGGDPEEIGRRGAEYVRSLLDEQEPG